MTRKKRIHAPVADALRAVRGAGKDGASTTEVAKAIHLGSGKTRCILRGLGDVGLVRVGFAHSSVWVACPPVADEGEALRNAAYASREYIRARSAAVAAKQDRS